MRRQRAARGENSRDKSADEDDVEGGDDYEDEKSWLIVIGDHNNR